MSPGISEQESYTIIIVPQERLTHCALLIVCDCTYDVCESERGNSLGSVAEPLAKVLIMQRTDNQ